VFIAGTEPSETCTLQITRKTQRARRHADLCDPIRVFPRSPRLSAYAMIRIAPQRRLFLELNDCCAAAAFFGRREVEPLHLGMV